MKTKFVASILAAVMLLCIPMIGYAAEEQQLVGEISGMPEEETAAVENMYDSVSTYSTNARSVSYNILIDEYYTWNCAQRYGEDIELYFTLINSSRSDEQYYIYIYDENEKLLANTSGYFPSGNEGDINYLTITWFWRDQLPGKYYVEFYSTSDQSSMGYLFAFYIAEPGAEQEIEISVPYTTLLVGETVQINAVATGGYVEYYSYDESVASVDGTGKVTALSPGTVEIEVLAYPTTTYPWNYKTITIRVGSQPIEDFVRRYYVNIMGREPDTGGLNYWLNLLKTGQKTAADVADYFIFCDEFIEQKNSDSVFLDRLYITFFDRVADSGGKAYWLNYLTKGATRRWVAAQFINSAEFQEVCDEYGLVRGTLQLKKYADKNAKLTMYVVRCYKEILGRSADASGLEYWCKAISTGEKAATDVAKNFVTSKEFIKKNLSNTEYVKVLYRAFMDREADAGGLKYWLGRLEKKESRESVLDGFAGCKEFQDILDSFGLKK